MPPDESWFVTSRNARQNHIKKGVVSLTKELARLLIATQAASDAGKGIYSFCVLMKDKKLASEAYSMDYVLKDQLLLKLIRMISRWPQEDLHFFVQKDEERIAKYIVYFDFRVGKTRLQASFHSFNEALKRFVRKSKGSQGKWDMGSSRVSLYLLGVALGLVEEVDDVDALR